MVWFWLGLTVALTVVEATTVQLVSIWFATGAAASAIVTAIFPSLAVPWQILIFTASSLLLLIATRPFVNKFLLKRKGDHQTNLELLIGKSAIVTEAIDNIRGVGTVKINGLIWSARSQDGNNISDGEIVTFVCIQGNKAIVSRKGE